MSYFNKRRTNVRRRLRQLNLLPPYGEPLNDEQLKIENQIMNNDFSIIDKINKENKKTPKTIRVHKPEAQNGLRIQRRLFELRNVGILPKLGDEKNQIQTEIEELVLNNPTIPIKSLISKYSYLTTPEYHLLYRVRINSYKKKINETNNFDLTIEDINIPKYCPYLNVELLTDIKDSGHPNYYTLDRIDSSKGYIKGNVQVISKFANTMKNNATIEQLIIFAKNILSYHTDFTE